MQTLSCRTKIFTTHVSYDEGWLVLHLAKIDKVVKKFMTLFLNDRIFDLTLKSFSIENDLLS